MLFLCQKQKKGNSPLSASDNQKDIVCSSSDAVRFLNSVFPGPGRFLSGMMDRGLFCFRDSPRCAFEITSLAICLALTTSTGQAVK